MFEFQCIPLVNARTAFNLLSPLFQKFFSFDRVPTKWASGPLARSPSSSWSASSLMSIFCTIRRSNSYCLSSLTWASLILHFFAVKSCNMSGFSTQNPWRFFMRTISSKAMEPTFYDGDIVPCDWINVGKRCGCFRRLATVSPQRQRDLVWWTTTIDWTREKRYLTIHSRPFPEHGTIFTHLSSVEIAAFVRIVCVFTFGDPFEETFRQFRFQSRVKVHLHGQTAQIGATLHLLNVSHSQTDLHE